MNVPVRVVSKVVVCVVDDRIVETAVVVDCTIVMVSITVYDVDVVIVSVLLTSGAPMSVKNDLNSVKVDRVIRDVVDAVVVVEVVEALESELLNIVVKPPGVNGSTFPILFQAASVNHIGGMGSLFSGLMLVVTNQGAPAMLLSNSLMTFRPGVYLPILFCPCSANHTLFESSMEIP